MKWKLLLGSPVKDGIVQEVAECASFSLHDMHESGVRCSF